MTSILKEHPDTLHLTKDILNIPNNNPTMETGLFVSGFSDQQIVEKIESIKSKKIIFEKTPSHIFALERIKRLFENSKIILIKRNHLDVLYSMIQKNTFWLNSPRKLMDALKLYKQFYVAQEAFKNYSYIINYEELWENPKKEISKLFEFLELNPSNIDSIIEKTINGKNLPPGLSSVFRNGCPNQGSREFTQNQIKLISKVLSWRKLKILITNHHLTGKTGSENLTITLAKTLKSFGNDITIYSKYISSENLQRIDKEINVVSNLDAIKNESFDIAHVHHNVAAYEVRNCFPQLPMIFYSQGILPFLEQPPIIDVGIIKYLAISEEVKSHLVAKNISSDNIYILRNFVDHDLFSTPDNINEIPKRVLVVSRNIDDEKSKTILEACERLNLIVEFVGGRFGEVSQIDLTDKIRSSDIVFSLGRGAIESMMMGKAVIVYDYLGGDGMVTPDNYYEIRKNNFSGRRYKKIFDVNSLINEINKYDKEKIEKLTSIIISEHSADNIGIKLIDIYNNILNDINNLDNLNYSSISHISKLIKETKEASEHFAYSNAVKITTDSFIDKLIVLAEKCINQKNYSVAKDILLLCLDYNPNHIDALNDLGVIEIILQNYQDAIEKIQKVLSQSPDDEIALGNLVYIQNLIQDYTKVGHGHN